MSDETEDGPEVREIYEKSTGYTIGHFPAHTGHMTGGCVTVRDNTHEFLSGYLDLLLL